MSTHKKTVMIKIYDYFAKKINFAEKKVDNARLHFKSIDKKMKNWENENAIHLSIITIFILGLRRKYAKKILKRYEDELILKKEALRALLKANFQKPIEFIDNEIMRIYLDVFCLPCACAISIKSPSAEILQRELIGYKKFLTDALSRKQITL